jgi:ComEC/Rec2-related protein
MVNAIEEPKNLINQNFSTETTPVSGSSEAEGAQIDSVAPAQTASETVEMDAEPDNQQRLREISTKLLPEKAPQKLLSQVEDFAVPALVLFLLGCALAFALPDLAFAQWRVAVPLLLVFTGIILYGINKPDTRTVIRVDIWAMILILGAMYYHYGQFTPGPTDISKLAPQEQVELMGTVTQALAANRLVLDVHQANQKKVSGQVIVYLPKNRDRQPLEAGTRLLINGELSLPFASSLPGVFNYRAYLKGQHITALLKHPSRMIAFETSNQPQFALQRWTEQLKQTVAQTFAKALPSPQAEVLGGIVLGDKAIPVDAGTKQAFIQTGLIHVLAASGMNVGIIAMAVLWLMKQCKVSRKTQFGVAMAAVAFYSLLTGLPPSIQRAAAMLELALLLKMLNKALSPLFLLCVASTLLILIAPDNIGSVGFQFSVLTTFGLLAMVSPLQDYLGYYITRWLAGLILVPLVAQLWIWPLSIAYFNQFPVHSVPLNIAALGLVTPLTIIGFTAGLASILYAPLGAALSWLARPFLDALLWVVQGGNSLSWAQWSLPSPAPWQIVGLYLCLFTLLAVMYRFQKWPLERRALLGLIPIACLLGGLCLENSQAQSQTRLEWLPLSGDKQAVLLQPAHSQAAILISPQRLRFYEARSLGDFLKHRHISVLSALLLIPPVGDDTSGTGSLKQAFQQTEIGILISAPSFHKPDSLVVKAQQAFPTQGAQLTVGNTHLEGQLSQLMVVNGPYCLLALSHPSPSQAPGSELPEPSPASESCAVQAGFGEQNIQQAAAQSSLSAGQYHQWIQEGPHLTLF